jgi:hypothetical protein
VGELSSFEVATVLATAIVAVTAAPARGQSADCHAAFTPMSKVYDKPFHVYMVDTAQTDAGLHGGKPTISETIWTGSAYYVLVRGKWIKSPLNIAEMRQMKDTATKGTDTCSHVRDESVDGESASVWHIHSVREDATTDTDEWVSKIRGVVLKADIHQDVGGAFGKSHIVSRYDYTNVRPPAGVP